jgi:hypothetical protein
MNKPLLALAAIALLGTAGGVCLLVAGAAAQTPTPSDTPSSTPSETPSPTVTPTPGSTASPMQTPIPTLIVVADCPFPAPPTGPIINVAAAPIIVIGTAGETVSFLSPEPVNIFSDTSFQVETVVRGEVASIITIRALGGTVGNLTQTMSHGQVIFTKDERSRLFLELTSEGVYRVVAGSDGKQDAPAGVAPSNPACALQAARVPGTGGRIAEQHR